MTTASCAKADARCNRTGAALPCCAGTAPNHGGLGMKDLVALQREREALIERLEAVERLLALLRATGDALA